MHGFIQFMASGSGRFIRAILGLAILSWGAFGVEQVNWVLVIIGLIPLAAGLFDFCILAPVFNMPFLGKSIRREKQIAK